MPVPSRLPSCGRRYRCQQLPLTECRTYLALRLLLCRRSARLLCRDRRSGRGCREGRRLPGTGMYCDRCQRRLWMAEPLATVPIAIEVKTYSSTFFPQTNIATLGLVLSLFLPNPARYIHVLPKLSRLVLRVCPCNAYSGIN